MAQAQDRQKPKYLRDNNKAFLKTVYYASDNGWLEFRDDTISLEVDSFFEQQGNALGIGPNYHFKKIKDESDDRGLRVQRFQLYYKNLEVEGVEYSLSTQKGRLKTAFGRIVEGIDMDISKPMDERKALEIALTDQKITINDIKDAAKIPKGKLLIARIQDNFIKESYRLSYHFDITGKEPNEPYRIYIDAVSGEIVKRVPLIHHCFSPHHSHAQPSTLSKHSSADVKIAPLVASTFIPNRNRYLNGQSNLTFETEQFTTPQGQSAYRLSAYNNALNTRIVTNNNIEWANNPDVPNPTTSWGSNANNATTAHWFVQRVQQYYQDKHQRNGINGSGAFPRVVVDMNTVDAHWNLVDQIRFGFGPISQTAVVPDQNRTLVIADVVAHEYTHAVTQFTANLSYTGGESGPLNESFSDIMGTAFERYLFPNNWNWDIGEDSYQIRDMANPSRAFPPFVPMAGQPDTYLGPRWDPGNEPHTNSGVMNKWFHTLYTGQAPNGEQLTPISFDNAINIVYRALRFYLHSSSGFADARDATMAAARDLYGNCSLEHRQVQEAWRTANLVAQYPPCNAECNFTVTPVAINVVCGATLTLTANCSGSGSSCNNITYDWVGPNINNTVRGQTVTVTAPSTNGTYSYQLLQTKVGCNFISTSFTVNVNCGSPAATLSGCYTIKSVQTNQLLEAISGNLVEQRGANSTDSQKWKAESAGTDQYRFVSQNGSGLVMSVNALNNGELMRLSSTANDNRQIWTIQNNGSGDYRVHGSNSATWDMKNYGNDPQLQLWGNTSESFQNQRLFRFESTGCPTGTNPPTNPPTGGTLTIVAPTYNCTTGSLTINTTGGNGSTIEYQVPGLATWTTNPTFTVPSWQLNGTSFTLQVRQSGVQANSYTYVTTCDGGTPPTNPPTGGTLTIIAPTYNCTTGSLTINTTGGNGTTIEYQVPGLGVWTTNSTFTVPSWQLNGTTFTLQVRQSGVQANSYSYLTTCGGGRLSAIPSSESTERLRVNPNPTDGLAQVRFYLGKGKKATLSIAAIDGRTVYTKPVVGTDGEQEVSIDLRQQADGMYLIRLSNNKMNQTVKLLLQH